MAKKQFNLETELTGKIDDLTAKLNKANSQVGKYKNQTKKESGKYVDAAALRYRQRANHRAYG